MRLGLGRFVIVVSFMRRVLAMIGGFAHDPRGWLGPDHLTPAKTSIAYEPPAVGHFPIGPKLDAVRLRQSGR